MHLEVTNFGDKKTVFFLEKVIIRLYNFTWGFYSQNNEISCGNKNWGVPPTPHLVRCFMFKAGRRTK